MQEFLDNLPLNKVELKKDQIADGNGNVPEIECEKCKMIPVDP